jgi:hypothetical protein
VDNDKPADPSALRLLQIGATQPALMKETSSVFKKFNKDGLENISRKSLVSMKLRRPLDCVSETEYIEHRSAHGRSEYHCEC